MLLLDAVLLLFLVTMIALGARVPVRPPVGASVSPLVAWVFLVPMASMGWAHVLVARRSLAGYAPLWAALERATRHPVWWFGVALGMAALVLAQPPLLAALAGVPGLAGLGVGAGIRLAAPVRRAEGAKP